MSDTIIFEVKDKIAYLTLNRPESRNAINIAMYDRFDELWKQVNEDDGKSNQKVF